MRFKNVKNHVSSLLAAGIILSLFALTACGGGGGGGGDDGVVYTPVTKSDTYDGNARIFYVETSGNTELTYNFDLGIYNRHVYYIFTNTNLSVETTSPSCLSSIIEQDSDEDFSLERPQYSQNSSSTFKKGSLYRGKPEITDYNSNPWKYEGKDKNAESKGNLAIENNIKGPLKATVGDTNSFMNESTTDTIPATCRKVITDGTKTLNIWVANNCWTETGSGKDYYVTQTMVDALAAKFLASGTGNDVYDWVTNIYGAEWGSHSYSELITAATVNNNIHILLFDIDNDNSTTGGVLGFFWAKDNFKKTGTNSIAYSNEKIMFYLDAVMFATPASTPATWAITDAMPEEIISTLAHEFQHMIHFYQKNVLCNVADSDTWVNEMCSLVTEDLLADKLGVSGPIGTAPDGGRLPLFNYWSDGPLTAWLSGSDALISYSVSYAFGAYLARNYGGAELFKDIVQGVSGKSVYGDYRDVVEAVNAHNDTDADITMSDLMRNWGAAAVLSAFPVTSGRYKYNTSTSFSSTIGSITYNLSSINLFNYRYEYSSGVYRYGPYYYSTSGLNNYSSGTMSRGSNIYYKESTSSVSGMRSKTFRIPAGVKLTVVVKQ